MLGQKKARDAKGKFLADRAACELAGLYSRLGRMNELETLLKSVEKRTFLGGASERINLAREALWMMHNQPGVSFRCGPLALQSILKSDQSLLASAAIHALMEIFNSASTQKGFSLPQVAELSKKVGLNYQMAFRDSSRSEIGNRKSEIEFVVPSVVHWKVGHYAALVRQEGDKFVLQDPTFGNEVWATRQALEAETSGYFLIPPGELPRGWRSVDAKEGASVWGKGVTTSNDGDIYGPDDLQTGTCGGDGTGMPVASVHLMLANLQVRDTPVGYTPPVGPPVYFTVRYNHRDYLQPPSLVAKRLGSKWTHDWNGHLSVSGATATHLVAGGGARRFTGFDATTQTYALNQYDQTSLKRISSTNYVLTYPDGSKKIFGPLADGQGFLLSEVQDPVGNAVTLTYDGDMQLVALTDAIGQVTTISYEHTNNPALITKVTDPFGRFATFEYDSLAVPFPDVCPSNPNRVPYQYHDFLGKITDVLGLESRFLYQEHPDLPCQYDPPDPKSPASLFTDIIERMQTPYGSTVFTLSGGLPVSNTRIAQISYPDGSRERVEYNQSPNTIPDVVPPASIPTGMMAANSAMTARNTFHWSRSAAASSHGDYSKARIYHWYHKKGLFITSGMLESLKEPLENRVFFNYSGQTQANVEGSASTPTKIGRVLDDGQTQLYTMAYDSFGKLTNSIDPLGRTFSFTYATNGIDLLEVRQTRAGNNELLFRATYNNQHRPLTIVDAAGQTNTFTYNARGQLLTETNPKGETTSYFYGGDGPLLRMDGPLPGTNDSIRFNYDTLLRVRAITDESGYRVELDYDDMDRITRITHPDVTFEEFVYDRLDLASFRDRAGRQTSFDYDAMRQVRKQTDPLGRETRFDWCRCGQIGRLTDPMGRTTTWLTDIQGRPTAKQYADGSQVKYQYENTTSRLRFVIDEKQQVAEFAWNLDSTLKSVAYGNALIPTPGVSFQYDPDYARVVSMTDGTGTTACSYHPITGTPTLGAGSLASVDGPLANDTITYSYDQLGRPIHRAINGVGRAISFDAAGRLVGVTNAVGAFAYAYDGASGRLVSRLLPNGQSTERAYGNTIQDFALQRITHKVGTTPVSEFLYGCDVPAKRIATWSQQVEASPSSLHTFGYDAVNQLLSATVTNAGNLINTFAYTYDPSGNRLSEQVGVSNYTAIYNALNQISTTTTPGIARTNEWDALDRLVAVNVGNQRTEFTYDGLSRRVAIRQRVNGSEVAFRRFVWSGSEICEERDAAGAVTKRYFPQGMKVETGTNAGNYFYTRDHLGSVRELTDASGNVRARYAYDPYGGQTKLAGDMDVDFGFAGMFWSTEANLSLTYFRAYDSELGRWLSRDPLPGAEMSQGPNLYAYVGNDPVNLVDPFGLADTVRLWFVRHCAANPAACKEVVKAVGYGTGAVAGAKKIAETNPQAVNQAAQCTQSVAPQINRLQTLPGLASDTVKVLANTAPTVARAAPPLRDMALVAKRYSDFERSLASDPAGRFWQNFMDATQHWREYELTQEQAREMVMWISRWTDSLFPK